MVSIGKKVPNFSVAATGDRTLSLRDFSGHHLVLYFYPKDNTSGCTLEGRDFRDAHSTFVRAGAIILGVSRDSIKSHESFKCKEKFPFELASDGDESLCKLFNVIREKTLYGRKYMGIERSTFLIDRKGVLRQEWRKVTVKGHADEVLRAVHLLPK
jgi:peroxiredoxin Q/BCP